MSINQQGPKKPAPRPIVAGQGRPNFQDWPGIERQIWKRLVDAMPEGWFSTEVQPLLGRLCTSIATSIRVSKKIREIRDGEDWALLSQLGEIHARESKNIMDLSLRLRLSPDARFSPERVKTLKGQAAPPKRPWDKAA